VVVNLKKVTDIYTVDETKLTHAFQDACSNKKFKEFVYNLNIKEEVLMKYTSRLEEVFEEAENCANCKDLTTCKNKMEGYHYTAIGEDNIINFSYDACEKLEKKLKEDAYKSNLDIYDMPKNIKEASFKGIYKDDKARMPIIKYFKEFMENYNNTDKPKGIYLHGSFGSGKTYLIAALFNEMAKKGVKSILIYYPEFLQRLKASFQTNYDEILYHVKTIPLLLFDDIGAENCSNWSRDEILGPIVQHRMENDLPTFFTSNLTLEELETALSVTSSGVDKVKAKRIIERIEQLTIPLELISKNRRD